MRYRNFSLLLAFLFACLMYASYPALAEDEPASVMLLQLPRKYYSNIMWTHEHTRMGGVELNNNIMGTGGEHDATMQYEVKGQFDMFESLIGFLDSAPDGRKATFELWADGVRLAKMGPLVSGDSPETMRVPIKGYKVITLRIIPNGYNGTSSAAWGDPKLWVNVKDKEIPGSVIVEYGERVYQTVPNKYLEDREVNVPIPLKPGKNTYIITTEYSEVSGKVIVKTVKDSKNSENYQLEPPQERPEFRQNQ